MFLLSFIPSHLYYILTAYSFIIQLKLIFVLGKTLEIMKSQSEHYSNINGKKESQTATNSQGKSTMYILLL